MKKLNRLVLQATLAGLLFGVSATGLIMRAAQRAPASFLVVGVAALLCAVIMVISVVIQTQQFSTDKS